MKSLLTDSKHFALLLAITLLLSLLDYAKLLNVARSTVGFIANPIQYGLYRSYVSVNNQLSYVTAARRAAQENKAMREQIAQILSENANLRRKLAETESFVEQKNSLNPQTFQLLAARPIGMARFLKIDRGSDDGVKVGQVVVYKDNLLGEIKQVSPKYSEVMLITHSDSKISAFVSNDTGNAKGILQGRFGTELLLDKVLHQEKIAEKDIVYTEGAEGNIPRGLVLGQIIQVIEPENDVFKQAKVGTVFTISELEAVFVITD